MLKTWIPELPEGIIRELSIHIQPMVRRNNHLYVVGGTGDIFNESYVWDPRGLRRIRRGSFREVARIPTYHPYEPTNINKFIPKVGAVLAQIPAEHRPSVCAFEIIPSSYQMSDPGLPEYHKVKAFNDGLHTGTTILYARR